MSIAILVVCGFEDIWNWKCCIFLLALAAIFPSNFLSLLTGANKKQN